MAEGGRPSERGHLKLGCLAGLVTLPLVLLRLALAELFPTKTRLRLLRAATETRFNHPRIYGEANEFWDAEGGKVTAAVSEQIRAGWLATRDRVAGRIPVQITSAGEHVLAEHEEKDDA